MEKDRNGQEHEDYVLLVKGAEAELVEKKSRFIATVRPVASEEEAAVFIEEMKKKYYDARHNCSAFVIGSRAQITRSSDDGEPSGTAGRPIRAYSGVLKDALAKCETARQHFGVRMLVRTDYNAVGKIQYLLAGRNISIEDSVYAADVEMTVIAPIEEYDRLCKEIVEATSARARIEEIERLYYFD